MKRLALSCLLLTTTLLAQQPATQPAAPPVAAANGKVEPGSELTEPQRQLALRVLRRHAELSKDVAVLAADYVQRRTTALSKQPLLSSGKFLFVRQPQCVMFRAEQPRESVVRLTPEHYEVYRASRQRLERFVLDGPELSQGLFAAVRGDAERLLQDFEIVGVTEVAVVVKPATPTDGVAETPAGTSAKTPAEPYAEHPAKTLVAAAPERVQAVTVRLLPKLKATSQRLRELLITLWVAKQQPEQVRLRAIAYRDPAGDLVEIELQQLRPNPEQAPTAELHVPAGTKIIEHRCGQ